MSKELMLEKLKKSTWFVLPYDIKTSRYSKILNRKHALFKGKIILGADEISIEDFSLKYVNIIRFEKEDNYLINLFSVDGKNYKLFIGPTARKAIKLRNEVFLFLSEKIKQHDAIESIKGLPKLYKEINLDKLSSRVGLERSETVNIIESLILNGELKAEIRGDILTLKKKPEAVASPPGYTSETSPIQGSEKREGMLVFVSYATKDAELYKIPELARALEEYKEISEVLYWQEDIHDCIIEYMNDNLGRCDGVLLFCSPNALDSIPVKKEWMAAEALKKPIIPIFLKPEHIPPLLSDRLGFEFDTFDFQKNVREIHELLLKKKQS